MTNPTRRDDELIRRDDLDAELDIFSQLKSVGSIEKIFLGVLREQLNAIPAANPAQGGECALKLTVQDIDDLRKRYAPSVIPPCRVCGGELSISSCGGGNATTYACSMQEDDPDRSGWLRMKSGRGENEYGKGGHYSDSQWTDRHGPGDERVIALLDAVLASSPAAPAAVAQETGELLPYDFSKSRQDQLPGTAAPSPSPAISMPVAYLHIVVQDDGFEDQALSFAPDSFPFEGVGGFKSIRHEPLYRHALAAPAVAREVDGRVVELLDWMDTRVLTSSERDCMKQLRAIVSPPSPLGGGGES